MQTYPKRSRHGDIGEHLVAFRIMRDLGWPCRLLNIDIGVDAEVEILDDNSCSTGDVIKLQIKSVENASHDRALSIYVDDEHIKYWTRFSTPLVFCGVDLKSEEVFCRQITALDSYETEGVSKKVMLDRNVHKLGLSTKDLWRTFMSPPATHELRALMTNYESLAASVKNGAGDLDTAVAYAETFDELDALERKIFQLITHIPWKITGVQLAEFARIRQEVKNGKIENTKTANEFIEGS